MARTRQEIQRLQSRLLDLVSCMTLFGFLYQHPHWINPWNLSILHWILGGLGIRAAITFYDHLVLFVIESSGATLLPTRTTGTPVRYVSLDRTSYLYLLCNAIHEWVFVQRLCHYMWHSSIISKNLADIGIFNTVGALYIMFIVNDIVYAPCHHILHMPWCYPLIHKHHHRQHYPTRGYLDAGNEHPLEHLVGVSSAWAAILTAVHTTGAHAILVVLFFNVHAALAILNHCPYHIQWNVLGIHYSVANHEMHHRKFTVNYAQYCPWYDHFMNTYATYEGPSSSKNSSSTTTTTTTTTTTIGSCNGSMNGNGNDSHMTTATNPKVE